MKCCLEKQLNNDFHARLTNKPLRRLNERTQRVFIIGECSRTEPSVAWCNTQKGEIIIIAVWVEWVIGWWGTFTLSFSEKMQSVCTCCQFVTDGERARERISVFLFWEWGVICARKSAETSPVSTRMHLSMKNEITSKCHRNLSKAKWPWIKPKHAFSLTHSTRTYTHTHGYTQRAHKMSADFPFAKSKCLSARLQPR